MQPWEAGPWYELRLGPTPQIPNGQYVDPKYLPALRAFNRYADLVGISRGEIQVVEAKMMADPGAISQLQHYVDLVRTTPLIRTYPNQIVTPILLWAIDDPIISQRAQAAGIRVEIFTPPWVNEWLKRKFTPPDVSA